MTEHHPLQDIAQPPTYLHTQNAQLLAQIQQMQQLMNQRFTSTVVDFMNGLLVFLNLAQQGDQGAQQMLRQIHETLKQIQEQSSPITVIHSA